MPRALHWLLILAVVAIPAASFAEEAAGDSGAALTAPTPEARVDLTTEVKPEAKTEAKPESKPETSPEAKPETKAETKPEPVEPLNLPGETANGPNGVVALWAKYLRIGQKAFEQGDNDLAQKMYEQALTQAEQLGDKDERLASTLENLASLYVAEGRGGDAVALAKRALAIRERVEGAEGRGVADNLCLLASVYRFQDQAADAEAAARRALAIREKALAAGDPDLAVAFAMLAAVLADERKYDEAEDFYKKAMAVYDRGKASAAQSGNLEDYARMLWRTGRSSDAESLLLRAVGIREALDGKDSQSAAVPLRTLASMYLSIGKVPQAAPICRRLLEIDHANEKTTRQVDLATDMDNMGLVYSTIGKYEMAQQMFEMALEIRERAVGPDSFPTAQTLVNLAGVLGDQRNFERADPLFLRAIAIDQKAGGDDPTLAQDLISYGEMLMKAGRWGDALERLSRAQIIQEKVLGAQSAEVNRVLRDLALVWKWQRRYAQAEEAARRILTADEKALSPDDERIASDLDLVAAVCLASGKRAEAGAAYERSLAIRERLAEDDAQALSGRALRLAQLFEREGDFARASEQCRRAMNIAEGKFGAKHAYVAALQSDYQRIQRSGSKGDADDKFGARGKIVRSKNGQVK